MPNWCFNRIDTERPLPVFTTDKDGKTTFDFNTIVPMPKSLNITSGSDTEISIVTYLTNKFTIDGLSEAARQLIDATCNRCLLFGSQKRTIAEIISENKARYDKAKKRRQAKLFKDGGIYVNNYLLYGFTDWYGWRNKHWDTKWNASDVWCDYTTIEFDTPWGPPFGVVEAMSRMFPEDRIELEWSEEAGWRGHQVYLNGEVVEELTPSDCLDDYWYDPEEENDGESDESDESEDSATA